MRGKSKRPSPRPPRAPRAPKPARARRGSRFRRAGWSLLSEFTRHRNPIVPQSTVVGRSLIFVTAVMCFLACIALGTAWAVHRAAQSWTVDAAREVTIQIKPVGGTTPDAQISAALKVIGKTRGIAGHKVFTPEENARFLEPWLGSGLDLGDLPVPQLIALELDPVVPPDMANLAQELNREVPGAALDDHRFWQAQIRSVAGWIQLISFAVLALMLAATIAIVVYATRGAMAGNRDIVNVLHLVGARQRFIAAEFQRHFLLLGLKGGLIGGAAAAIVFVGARVILASVAAPLGGGYNALIHSLSIGWSGYAGIAGIVACLAVLSAVTSSITVHRYLELVE